MRLVGCSSPASLHSHTSHPCLACVMSGGGWLQSPAFQPRLPPSAFGETKKPALRCRSLAAAVFRPLNSCCAPFSPPPPRPTAVGPAHKGSSPTRVIEPKRQASSRRLSAAPRQLPSTSPPLRPQSGTVICTGHRAYAPCCFRISHTTNSHQACGIGCEGTARTAVLLAHLLGRQHTAHVGEMQRTPTPAMRRGCQLAPRLSHRTQMSHKQADVGVEQSHSSGRRPLHPTRTQRFAPLADPRGWSGVISAALMAQGAAALRTTTFASACWRCRQWYELTAIVQPSLCLDEWVGRSAVIKSR